MSKYLLSIVVPTKNRNVYALSCVKAILGIPSVELELVVQDQNEDSELETLLSEIHDSRLSYQRSTAPKNHVENFNLAVRRATGRYVVVIGDDDGVSRYIVDAARWAESRNLDALTPVQCATYQWPDYTHRVWGKAISGKLLLSDYGCKTFEPDVESELASWVQSPKRNTAGLPKVYHGIVRRSLLQKLYESHDGCFFGVSPDIASAIAITRYLGNFITIDFPLVIAGASGGSAAGRGALGSHVGDLKEDPHMRGFEDKVWPELIPAFFSVETVMAESAIEGLVVADRSDLLKDFNFTNLLATCLYQHPDRREMIFSRISLIAKSTGRSRFSILFSMTSILVGLLLQRIQRLLWRVVHPLPAGSSLVVGEFNDIQSACAGLDSHLSRGGFDFMEKFS